MHAAADTDRQIVAERERSVDAELDRRRYSVHREAESIVSGD